MKRSDEIGTGIAMLLCSGASVISIFFNSAFGAPIAFCALVTFFYGIEMLEGKRK
jgi:hypothetical protein